MALSHKLVLISVLIGAILIIIPTAEAFDRYTVANGDWNNGFTWDLGVLPSNYDDINITHNVSIVGDYQANVSSLGINSSGKLIMNFNETAKLNVIFNVTIESGGIIQLGDLNSQFGSILKL